MAFAFKPVAAPQLIQGVALLAALAGLATWGPLLLAPPVATPGNATAETVPAAPAAAQQWFANLPAQVEITLSGLLARGVDAVAIISLNGGPPQAVRAGEQLARGVHLVAIESDGLVLDRAGERSHVAITRLPDAPALPSLIRP